MDISYVAIFYIQFIATFTFKKKGLFDIEGRLTSSSPITPAPMTTNFSGILLSFRAPVDETIVSSSIWNNRERVSVKK